MTSGQGHLAMRRREFMALLGAAAGLRPLAALAQRDRVPRIGVLAPNSSILTPLVQRLRELGWRSVRIEYRGDEADATKMTLRASRCRALSQKS
jgi:hypothetical protein